MENKLKKPLKERVMTIRFNEIELKDYANRALKLKISTAEFLRINIKKGLTN